MKTKVFTILTVIILCLSFVFPASAADTHIIDLTGSITADAVNALEQQAQQIEDTYDFEVIFSLIDGVGAEGTYGYTQDLFNARAEGDNGIALTYNYGDNKYAFYCSGTGETLFPEEVQSNTLWNAFAYTETYYDGVYEYLVAVESVLSQASDTTNTDENTTDVVTEETTEFVPSDRTLPLVVDNADVLSADEEAAITTRLEEIGAANNLEIGVLTVDSYEGKDPQAFADDFYDYNGYGYGENNDGLIVVFNTGEEDGNRNIAISTHGKAIDLLTDMEIDVIIEMMITPIKNGDIAGAFDNFADECESSLKTGISLFWIPASVVIGFALAFLIVKIQASKLKTVRQQVDAADYVGNVNLTYQADNFMYRDVNRSEKKTESSGGSSTGGSSTHTSSSGRTHGGGNKSF